jgi:RNA polymerase sigma factor (TIGR02999 family)
LLDRVYADLLKIAHAELGRHQRGATLDTRALVNEAYIKLFAGAASDYSSRQHFFATAARAMRQVIIQYARMRLADRRGCGAEHVSLDHLDAQALPIDSQAERLVAIDSALSKLAALDPRLAQVIELRFFAGMEVDELANLLEVSVPTIVRDTRTAKAFLQNELDLAAPTDS